MTVLPMIAAHVPQMAAIELQCFSDPWSADGFAAELTQPAAQNLVAADETGVLGYLCVQEVGDFAYISNLAVRPDARRRGVGSALLRAACAGAQARGCAEISLEVRESNLAARALYAAHGFQILGKRKHFYEHPVEDGVVCTKYFTQEGTV